MPNWKCAKKVEIKGNIVKNRTIRYKCSYKMAESVRNLHLVLFIGVMCVVQTLAQVCPYSDPRCTCYVDRTICSNLQQIPPVYRGVNASQVATLIFQGGIITSISKNDLPPGLSVIELLHNPFTNISDDAFDSSAETLQTIHIREAKLNSLPTALKQLTALTNLYIVDTRIQDWDAATLKQTASTLQYLELNNVGLSSWPSWISNFHLLQYIDLRWNSLKYIPDDAFSFIKDSLTYLDLSGTGLTHVPQALSILTHLYILDLSNNNFTDVSEVEQITASPFAQKLNYLYLNSNSLTRIVNFSNLTSLRSLSLHDNRLSDVPAGALPASLKELTLGQNNFSSVPLVVASLSQLFYLDLSDNLITGFEPNTLPSSLSNLELSFNSITIITNSSLRNLRFLSALNLDNNPISTISPSAFSDLVSFNFLYLTNSHLTEIPLAFAQLSPQIVMYWTTTQPLSCPCPTPPELVQWFASLTYNLLQSVFCSNGQSVQSYLRGQCGQSTVTP